MTDVLVTTLDHDTAWHDLAFIHGHDIHRCWETPEIRHEDATAQYVAECDWGRDAALQLIGYMHDHEVSESLSSVVESIMKRGRWSGFEIGFFAAIGEYLRVGSVWLCGDMVAIQDKPEQQ